MDTDVTIFDVNIWVSALLAFEKSWMTSRLKGAKNYAFSKENFITFCVNSKDPRVSDLGLSLDLGKVPSSYRIDESLKRVFSKVFNMSPSRLGNILNVYSTSCRQDIRMDGALDNEHVVSKAADSVYEDFNEVAPQDTARLDPYTYRKVESSDPGIDMEDMILAHLIRNFAKKNPSTKFSFVTADKAFASGLEKIVLASRFPKTQVVLYANLKNAWVCLNGTKILDLEKTAKLYMRKPFKHGPSRTSVVERRA